MLGGAWRHGASVYHELQYLVQAWLTPLEPVSGLLSSL